MFRGRLSSIGPFNRVAFQAFTLERFIDALAEAGADGLAGDLWGRYCDFERVYHLALGEHLENPSSPAVVAPLAPPPATRHQGIASSGHKNEGG